MKLLMTMAALAVAVARRPWTISFPLRREPGYGFYEYACHEGNYAMPNILSGARADDRTALGK